MVRDQGGDACNGNSCYLKQGGSKSYSYLVVALAANLLNKVP